MKTKEIEKETISTYAAHMDSGKYIIEYLSSIIVYEYGQDKLLLHSSLQCYDKDGGLTDSSMTKRRAHKEGYIYERYNHNGVVEGYSVCDKEGRELESTLLGHHVMTYNPDGQLIKSRSAYNDGDEHEIQYVYAPSGDLVQTVESKNGATKVLQIHYSSDLWGNRVETTMDRDGNQVRVDVIDKTTGNIIETRELCTEDPSIIDISYYRNILTPTYSARYRKDELIHSRHRMLEYDTMGNWVMEVEMNNVPDEPSLYIRVREIKYFNDSHDDFFTIPTF